MPSQNTPIDLAGQRIGRLTILRIASPGTHKTGRKWLCKCDCGSERSIFQDSLRSKKPTTSCGCYRREVTAVIRKTHGLAKTPEHIAWMGLRNRCNNVNDDSYHNYGGRGITVCERWDSFENFLSDMGDRPTPQHSIDRRNNLGNYEPSNCRWATAQEQSENTRRTRRLTFNGKTQSLSAWARELNISRATLRERLEKWTIERALSTVKSM